MVRKCFVIQRFDGGRYDRLYHEIFSPAIELAGFQQYRVDQDPGASIPIESIEREISESDACFAEISEDNPNVWFELGYSIAREKPLCLVCSSTRTRFPFDIQHRLVIRYPSDFDELRTRIADRMKSVVLSGLSLQMNANTVKGMSIARDTSGLKPHELLALTIVFQSQFVGSITGWSLQQDMERGGFTAAASGLAITGLRRKGFIDVKRERDSDGERIDLEVTPEGEEWLMEHQDQLNLQIEYPRQKKASEDFNF